MEEKIFIQSIPCKQLVLSFKGAQGSSPLMEYNYLYTKKIFTWKFDNSSLISKKSYLSFSIHNKYPTGAMMIPLTLVKINSKKSKIKTNLKKVLQRHKWLNTIQPVHKIIHVLCLMNFYTVLTSNLIIKEARAGCGLKKRLREFFLFLHM